MAQGPYAERTLLRYMFKNMLDLDSPRWSELSHAYGAGSNIPALLRQLSGLPEATEEAEPWFSLWSALAHQGDVFSASFVAVPHIVAALGSSPEKASATYFQFPAWVEICRQRNAVKVPDDLEPAYRDALGKLPGLVALASSRPWDHAFLVCALSAIAAVKGFPSIAGAVLELTPDTADKFLDMLF